MPIDQFISDAQYPEQVLWLRVIEAVLDDILVPKSERSVQNQHALDREEAISYFKRRDHDFEELCALCDLDDAYVYDNIMKRIEKEL